MTTGNVAIQGSRPKALKERRACLCTCRTGLTLLFLFLKVIYFILKKENLNVKTNNKTKIIHIPKRQRLHSGVVLRNLFPVSPSSTYFVCICNFLFKSGTIVWYIAYIVFSFLFYFFGIRFSKHFAVLLKTFQNTFNYCILFYSIAVP